VTFSGMGSDLNPGSAEVNNVQVYVYYGDTPEYDESIVYRGVQVTMGSQTLTASEDDPPPVSTTADTFQGAMVMNDTDTPSNLRFSVQGSMESCCSLYYLPFSLTAGDRLTYIKSLGRSLLVGAQHGFWRVNYLPTSDSVNMDRGSVSDQFDMAYGPMSETAACTFTGPDGRPLCAYATLVDIRATDGFSTWPVLPDFPFADEVETTEKVILINNPANWELVFYFSPKEGGQIATELGWEQAMLRLNYHPGHLKDNPWGAQFRFKCSPVIYTAIG